MEMNSCKITGMTINPKNNSCISISEDSTIRMWDFINKREYYNRKFYSKGTCICEIPMNVKN